MLQPHEKEPGPSTFDDLTNAIKQLLEYQRYAIRRATSIGMSREEAAEMEHRINQIGELVDRLHAQQCLTATGSRGVETQIEAGLSAAVERPPSS